MIEPLAAELAARGARRVSIFGTRYSVESGFFGLLENIEFVRPLPDEVDFIHPTYEELLRDGHGAEAQHRDLTALAHTLRRRDGIDPILLAGTDLSLLFNESNTDFPHVDCAAVHIDVIVRNLLGS